MQSQREDKQKLKKETQVLIEALVIDDVIAHLLVNEGFKSIEAVAYVPLEELQSIEGFDDNLAKELKDRALAFLEEKEEEYENERVKLGVDDEMKDIDGLDSEMIVILGRNKIKTKNDLADLSSDELLEILEGKFDNNEEADKIIMKAREGWFKNSNSFTGKKRWIKKN